MRLVNNFWLNLATTLLLYLTFFFIPTWLSPWIEHKYGFVLAFLLLVIFHSNTSRLQKLRKETEDR